MMKKENQQGAKPKRKFSDILLLLLFVGVLALVAHGINGLIKTNVDAGDIQVYSGSAEILTEQRVTGVQNKKGSVSEGERFEIERDAENFPEIVLDQSIILEATQNPYGGMHYTVYEEDFDVEMNEEAEGILEEVYEKYGQYTAWKLRNMTHEEEPWKSTPINQVINKDKIKEFFKSKIA